MYTLGGVSPTAFHTVLNSWHDFYLAAGSASAALLGLLFVGVSINLSAISGAERVDLRTKADLAFSNLLYLLGLSLVALIPDAEPDTLAISFTVIAALGLARIGRRVLALWHARGGIWKRRDTLRRLAWTVVADLVLLYIAASLASTGDANWLLATPIVVCVLLVGAADVAWGLLVRESESVALPRLTRPAGRCAQRTRLDQERGRALSSGSAVPTTRARHHPAAGPRTAPRRSIPRSTRRRTSPGSRPA